MTKYKGIFIKNIYYMLAYAFDALKASDHKDIQVERFDNIHNMFASLLCRGISTQLKQGLYKEYREELEDLSTVRGKIYMPGTIRSRMQRKCTVACEFDELSENNLLNQIVKTTAFLLIRHPNLNGEYKAELKKEMLYFAEVDLIDPKTIRWKDIQIQRNSRNYRLLLAICWLITEGLLLTTEKGQYHLAASVDSQKMEDLYERFLRQYYIQEYEPYIPGFYVRDEWMDWQTDEDKTDDDETGLLPRMHTDVTITYGKKVLIMDAKYYTENLQEHKGVRSVHSDDLYQIFAYVKNKEAALVKNREDKDYEVSGMLLYARTEEELQPDQVYHLLGNKFSVRTLDLNTDFKNIRKQLDDIVYEHFGVSVRR